MAAAVKKGAMTRLPPSRTAALPVWKVGRVKKFHELRIKTDDEQKYTLQSTGVWERIRRLLAVDPNRSTGVPLNAQFRNPPPGANPPEAYDDPVTVPAADIADNAYFKRDMRRSYPRTSLLKQTDVVRLLTVGSKASPKDDVLQIGDAGDNKQVARVEEQHEKGLSAFFAEKKDISAGIFGPNGLPPSPSGLHKVSPAGSKQYVMDAQRAEGYPEE